MGLALRLAKAVVPRGYQPTLRQLYNRLRAPIYSGNAVYCPCCGGHFRTFLPGASGAPNSLCPGCTSAPRHRLLYVYLQDYTRFLQDRLRVLHFAPEYTLQRRFRTMPNLEYLSADPEYPLAMVKMDIMDIPYPEDHWDVVLCSHVLEHVPDDIKAISELYRVLKPGGFAILLVPIDYSREKTYEDPSVTDPKEREKLFGQWDHLRAYGQDYPDRLCSAGFQVSVERPARDLDAASRVRMGLSEEPLYVCRKA